MTNTLSMAGKLTRLRERLRTPEWRKYGQVLLMGKFLGIALVFMLALFMHPEMMGLGAHAADPELKEVMSVVAPINTVWTLVAAFLQVFQTAGRLHHARSRILPVTRDRERPDGVRGGHLPLRAALLRLGLRIHVQPRQRIHRHELVLPERRSGDL